MRAIDRYQALLLDAQMTFVFQGDRLGPDQDFHATYAALGGVTLPARTVNRAVLACVDHMWAAYKDPGQWERFPGLGQGFRAACPDLDLVPEEWALLERTVALHECGRVPQAHADCLRHLAETHRLAVVSNIWAPRAAWVEEFRAKGVLDLFETLVFSSDMGSVKPARLPFAKALRALDLDPHQALFVGDSMLRDVTGAKNAGMDAALVLNGNDPPEHPEPRPDFMVKSLLDLPDLKA